MLSFFPLSLLPSSCVYQCVCRYSSRQRFLASLQNVMLYVFIIDIFHIIHKIYQFDKIHLLININIEYSELQYQIFFGLFCTIIHITQKVNSGLARCGHVVPVSISFQFSTFPPYEAPKVANTLLVVTSNNLT